MEETIDVKSAGQEKVFGPQINEMDSILEESETTNTSDVAYAYKAPSRRTIALTMIFSFVVPMIIMALALFNTQIYPGGTNTLLTYDMKSQFMPIYASLRYLGKTQHSVLYTFYGALGNNALSNYSTYLINPLSWITVFFSLEKLPDIIYYLTVFRIGLAGLSFSVFLFLGKKKNREKRYPLAVFLLSCCYALMSFSIMYSICMNWLDIVALLPIMLTGIERIIEGRKGALYLFTLAFSLLNSFQLSYMAGIFMTMYLIYRLVEEKKKKWFSVVIRFACSSLCSLGLTMPVFLPMLLSMQGARTSSDVPVASLNAYINYPLWKVLKQLSSCQYDKIDVGGLPYLFCGSFTVFFVAIFFVKAKQNVSSKIIATLIILIYFASFCIVPLNKAWHGFIDPMCFPGRYSFTFSCFLLLLSYGAAPIFYEVIKVLGNLKGVMGTIVVFIIICEEYMNSAYIIASHNTELNYNSVQEYNSYVARMQDILGHIDDDGFYRVGNNDSYIIVNDGMIFGYNGMSYFSSFFNRGTMEFLSSLGFAQNEHVLYDVGGTPISEAMFGVKYIITEQCEKDGYTEVFNGNYPYSLYRNENALPLGYIMGAGERIINGEYIYVDDNNLGNAFLYQEILLTEILGEQCDVYNGIKYTIEDINDENARHVVVEFTVDEEKPIWVFFKPPTKEELDNNIVDVEIEEKTTVNGKRINHIKTDLSTVCTYIGTFKKGERIILEASDSKYFGNPWIVYYDSEIGNTALMTIKKYGLDITECRNGVIKGKILSPADNTCALITLPYMDGYRIRVDGVLTDYTDYRGSLILLPLMSGEHSLEISYIPPGFEIGIVIWCVSLLIAVFLLLQPCGRLINHKIYLTGEL